jgi:CRISPR-associated exonuclease Cas4
MSSSEDVAGHLYDEEELLPVSGLQHLLYCPRRAALVHIEDIWTDNIFTATGTIMQERVDSARRHESRQGVRIVRNLQVRSLRLGLTGKCDVVEFHSDPSAAGSLEQPFPVEHKRGALREEEGYLVQLCAQALCLEEMLDVPIPRGAIYFGATARRLEVEFDNDLRQRTEDAAQQLHALVTAGLTPPAECGPKCEKCSLKRMCLPQSTTSSNSAGAYLDSLFYDEEEP